MPAFSSLLVTIVDYLGGAAVLVLRGVREGVAEGRTRGFAAPAFTGCGLCRIRDRGWVR
jgi:hypothetical protein